MTDPPTRDHWKHSDHLGPAGLLRALLKELDESGFAYSLIHTSRRLEEAVLSDVDIAFDRNPNEVLLPILDRLSRTCGARLIQCLHYDIPHGYYYIVRGDGAGCDFLHLDCLYDPLGVNRYHLATPFLLENSISGPLGTQSQDERKALYLLMKRSIKGNASAEQLEVLRGCFGDPSSALSSHVQAWFGTGGRQLVTQLLRSQSAEETLTVLRRLRASASWNFLCKQSPRYLLSLLMNVLRKFRRLVSPTGLFIVLIGPDGSGKSTIAGLVVSELERAFRKTWRFHWRPNLLPKLRRRATEARGSEVVAKPPPEVSRQRGIVSLLRFLYYWLDFMIGYWLVIYPRKARTTLIIGERYFPDVLVNPHRYGFTVPRWLMRLAATSVPSPDLLVLLKDDPEVIHARKPELSPAKIASQIEAYELEAKYWGGVSVVITAGGPQAVAALVAELIVNESARRTEIRLAKSYGVPPWRGFPAGKNVKVWFNDADTLSNSLNLYHPYSKVGSFVKAAIGYLPQVAHRCLFRSRPNSHVARQLCLITRLIQQTLKDEGLTVSFFTGTPGPHRKLTAQVTRGKTLVAYVKVAERASVSTLLQHEAGMLAWLQSEKFEAATLPQVIALHHREQFTLLCLSAPTKRGIKRPLQPNAADAKFLSALGSLSADVVPVMQVLRQIGTDILLEGIGRKNASAAELVRHAVGAVSRLLGKDGVRVSACHGDYAPWNTLELEDATLYVFDWEYGSRVAPALYDLFHRVLMPDRLILAQPPRMIIDKLLELPTDPVLGRLVSRAVAKEQLPAYILLYLLGQLVRSDRDPPDEFLMESIRHVLTLTGRTAQRRTVLVSAYACEPGRGSEPGVGWQMCVAISREHEAWVITRKNNRPQIESVLAEQPNPHLHFRYADLPSWMRFWKRGGRGIRLYYYLWQFAALREAINLMRTVKFDVAHHITFVNDFTFTFLALLPIPYVWGPIGSVSKRPASLTDGTLSLLRERVQYYFKVLLRSVDPLFWLSAIRAKLVIGINDEIGRRFPLSVLAGEKYVSHVAIGVEGEVACRQLNSVRPRNEWRVLSIGRLVPLKAFHLSVRAFAALSQHEPTVSLTIVGDGPMQTALEKLAVDLRVRDKVNLIRWLPRSEALDLMTQADVFLFPSFEAAGMVVLEAMAHGLPVVCLEGTGPAQLITEQCGFAVRVGPMNDTVEKLADAVKVLLQHSSLRLRMGTAAQRLVQERYVWADRHKVIGQWYLAAAAETTTLPEKRAGKSGRATG